MGRKAVDDELEKTKGLRLTGSRIDQNNHCDLAIDLPAEVVASIVGGAGVLEFSEAG